MNKILYVARKAKGWSAKQLAELLKMEVSEYEEIENELKGLDSDTAFKLGKLFDLPPDYFFNSKIITTRQHLNIIGEISQILNNPALDSVPRSTYISTMGLGMKAIEAQEELKIALQQNLELERENAAIRMMYLELKKQQSTDSNSTKG